MAMHAAALWLRYRDGTIGTYGSDSVVPLTDLAKRIRVSGQYDEMEVAQGCVLQAGALGGVAFEFRCEAKTEATGNPSPDSAPAKRGRRGRG
jgi:hypothetical protein